jgi:hypothetical protein
MDLLQAAFESWTTGSLEGNVVSGDARFTDIADTTRREIFQFARAGHDRGGGRGQPPRGGALAGLAPAPDQSSRRRAPRWAHPTDACTTPDRVDCGYAGLVGRPDVTIG